LDGRLRAPVRHIRLEISARIRARSLLTYVMGLRGEKWGLPIIGGLLAR
jgi:hypothetical protein